MDFGAITALLEGFDPAALIPQLDTFLGRLEFFVRLFVLIGPLLLLNPPFTNYLLKLLGEERRLIFENEAYRAYEVRLKEYHRPDIKLES